MSDLDRAIRAVVRDCLAVAEGEQVLVAANPSTRELGERLRDEAAAAGADAVLAISTEREADGTEPPPSVAAAMAAADVVMAPTARSISHTEARRAANAAGARVATLPGVTADMLARMMTADVAELRRRGHALAEALTAASEAVLTSAEGTDLRMSLEGRSGIADAGEITAPGAFGNLPCGEGFIGPLEEAADGALVIDGTIAAYGRVPEPTRLELRDGRIVRAAGAAGQWLLDRLSAHGPEATGIAELGIGTNERAVLSGNVLEDEKLLGTVHIAFGASAGIGGVVQVPIHLDCVVMSPTLALDGEVILRDGRLLV